MAAYYISLFAVRETASKPSDSARKIILYIIKNNVCAKSIELIGLYVLHLRDTPIEIESKITCCCVLLLRRYFFFIFIFFLLSASVGLVRLVCLCNVDFSWSIRHNANELKTQQKKNYQFQVVWYMDQCSPTLPLLSAGIHQIQALHVIAGIKRQINTFLPVNIRLMYK